MNDFLEVVIVRFYHTEVFVHKVYENVIYVSLPFWVSHGIILVERSDLPVGVNECVEDNMRVYAEVNLSGKSENLVFKSWGL